MAESHIFAENGESRTGGQSRLRNLPLGMAATGTRQSGMSMPGYEGQVPAGRYDVHPEGMTRTTFKFNRKRSPAKASTEVKSLTGSVYIGHLNVRLPHLNGHNYLVIPKDGSPLPKCAPYLANTSNVDVEEIYDIEIKADNSRAWVFHGDLPLHTAGLNGLQGVKLVVDSTGGPMASDVLNTNCASMGNHSGVERLWHQTA